MATWIAWEKGLPEKPEIFKIARDLNISRYEATCRCMEVWGWADEHTEDGQIDGMQPEDLDAVAGMIDFGIAMRDAGWLLVDGQGIIFPNWDRWNTKTAKRRLRDAERKRHKREASTTKGDDE